MSIRIGAVCAAAVLAAGLAGCASQPETRLAAHPAASSYGIVAVKSAHPFPETVARLKEDVAAKGLVFFQEVDQQKLAAEAGIATQPSTLLVFGNPALGTQFITANPQAGIDWPVRLLVYQDAQGAVWAEYTDFAYIAERHAIASRDPQFQKASEVIASIAGSVAN
ncbi:DUF302 domain-containing protein [Dongia deserti]|uniref:DUF302 domain-containing protein n=1 Tax=Dongia deserti TaxID=2268030 RepID=UPI000E647D19|nr:DUF302 domain-containing protein [Dongia deserti]